MRTGRQWDHDLERWRPSPFPIESPEALTEPAYQISRWKWGAITSNRVASKEKRLKSCSFRNSLAGCNVAFSLWFRHQIGTANPHPSAECRPEKVLTVSCRLNLHFMQALRLTKSTRFSASFSDTVAASPG